MPAPIQFADLLAQFIVIRQKQFAMADIAQVQQDFFKLSLFTLQLWRVWRLIVQQRHLKRPFAQAACVVDRDAAVFQLP